MTADLLFTGGQIWLGPGRRSTALAVTGDRVSALGDEAVAAGAATVVDLDGGLLLPGFSDGHCHPPQAGLEKIGPLVSDLDSVEAIVAEVARFAAANPDLEWIKGGSYDPSLAEGGTFLAAWLDEVVPDRPVLLKAHDYHTAWCNSKALELAGITAATPDPEDGVIDRLPDGSPAGTLREPAGYGLVEALSPSATLAQQTEALRFACNAQAACGVTWMQDAWVTEEGHLPYLELLKADALTVRSNLAWLAEPDRWRDQLEIFGKVRAEVDAAGQPELLSAYSIKFFADGVIESATADMLEPYVDTHDHGTAIWEPAELAEAVVAIDALGFQTHIHAIGDAAVRNSLNAIEKAVKTNPEWDRRPVITHVQLADPVDLPRFAELNVTAAMQTFWAQQDDLMLQLTAPRLGEERSGRQYPVQTLTKLGARVSIASDWPVSTNYPIDAIAVAATRQNAAGLPSEGWVPEEKLPLEDGLLAATEGGAYQGFAENSRGKLAAGFLADLVWLDRDITAEDPSKARQAQVVGTWVGGKPTYSRS